MKAPRALLHPSRVRATSRAVLPVALFGLSAASVLAQEGVRNSIAGEAAAEARRRQFESLPYTVKSGDFKLLLSPSLGFDYNDNIRTSDSRQEDDFILRPSLGIGVTYPITQKNLLMIDVRVGYDYYFEADDLSGLNLSTGSQVSFDFSVGDFLFNFHDRFSYVQDSAREASVANTGSYGTFDNTIGLSVTWDLQDLVLTGGFDHLNTFSTSDQYSYTDRSTEIPSLRAGLRLNPRLTAGVEGSVSISSYQEPTLNDSTSYNAGIYADYAPGKAFHVIPRFGYALYDFEQTSLVLPAEDQDGWYADVTLSHAITGAMRYSLSFGREFRLGVDSDLVEAYYARLNYTWAFTRAMSATLGFSYENGSQGPGRAGPTGENYDQFGPNLGLTYAMTRKLNLSLNYRLTTRTSDVAGRDYTQNLVGLLITYRMS
jgi:hypothetical protein